VESTIALFGAIQSADPKITEKATSTLL
jgi:hypothetical protein